MTTTPKPTAFLYNDVGLYVPDLPTFQKLVNLNVASLCPLDLANSKKLPNHSPTRHSHFFLVRPDEPFGMTTGVLTTLTYSSAHFYFPFYHLKTTAHHYPNSIIKIFMIMAIFLYSMF